MSSQQKAIRDALSAKIATATGRTVFRSPRRGIARTELPAVCLFSHSDRPEADEDHQHAHKRVYTVRVEVQVEGRLEEDTTDSLCSLIRRAVLTDDSLGLPDVASITWAEQAWDGDEGEWPLSGSVLDFAISYLWRPE